MLEQIESVDLITMMDLLLCKILQSGILKGLQPEESQYIYKNKLVKNLYLNLNVQCILHAHSRIM